MNVDHKIQPLLHKTFFSSKEARELGINPSLLCYYAKKGIIKRVGFGLYQSKNTDIKLSRHHKTLVKSFKSVNKGILCLYSVLHYHHLFKSPTNAVWIAIPNNTTSPIRENIKFKRMRDLETGKVTISLGYQNIDIFNIERTILDLFREQNKTLALQVLKKTIAKGSIDLNKLMLYSKKMRINITPYLLALSV